jgi:hypothetical protein
LKTLRLQNYRCFENHTLPLGPFSVIVGRNNAGKSTTVEALRLVSLVAARCQSLTYVPPPRWTNLPTKTRGVVPSTNGLEINFQSIFYRHVDPPAIITITATFTSGHVIRIYIGRDSAIYATITDPAGTLANTKSQARALSLPTIAILPQIGPLRREETLRDADYVRSSMSSHLSSLHFRNQLFILRDESARFKELAERTWPGLRIRGLSLNDSLLNLMIQDGDFVNEVGLMGHGLQMWLQAMWFLARSDAHSTVILDEPDVYMHPDLQRRLVKISRGRYSQVIIATHSTEIMSEAEPEEVLVIDRERRTSKFTNSLPGIQSIIDHVGGVHNIQLARLWSAHRCLWVEGKDVEILRRLHNTLFPASQESFASIPNIALGGRAGLPYAIGSSMFLKNAGGDAITVYCILDRDYFPQEELEERYLEAERHGIQLHVWDRKEIENYLLVPEAIQRLIAEDANSVPSTAQIASKLDGIAQGLRHQTQDAIADKIYARHKNYGLAKCNQLAREYTDTAWKSRDTRLAIVSGKEMLAAITNWSKESFNVSFSAARVASTIQRHEIPEELADVLRAVEKAEPFTGGDPAA